MKSPFKFLDSYTKEDRDIFFGREKEIAELYHRVFDSRIMLVYGESGTGKSSLIQCGLANKFRDTDWLPVMIRRGDNLPDSISRAIKAAAITPVNYELLTTALFKKAIRSLYIDYYKPIFFIFDQFEELFIFGSKEEKQSLVHLVHALTESDIECRFIFVMREEYIANVTEFEKLVPGFNSNRIRIEKMAAANAMKAINGPCEVYDIDVEEGFADKLIKKLNPDSPGVELTWLQVYLDKIFNLAAASAGDQKETRAIAFTNSLLDKAGDVSDILGSFLDDQITLTGDKESALALLKSFVSVKGTKKQLTIDEARNNVHTLGATINDAGLMDMVQRFVHLRILCDKDQHGKYELRHDALAKKIFEKFTSVEKELIEIRQFIDNMWENWQRRKVLISAEDLEYISPYESKLHLPDEISELVNKSKKDLVRKKQLRRNLIGISGLAIIVVLSIFSVWALKERNKAKKSSIKALAENYNYLAKEVTEKDPTKALRLAEYALSLDTGNLNIKYNINNIYNDNNLYSIVARHYGLIYCIAVSSDGTGFVTGSDDRTAKLWDLKGNLLKTIYCGAAVFSVAYSPDGKHILTGHTNPRLWDLNGKLIREFTGHQPAKFSPDGKSILTGVGNFSAQLMDLDGNILKVFRGHTQSIQSVAFSPDGQMVATSSYDNTSRLYDIKGNLLTVLKGHNDHVLTIEFSPDGKTILTASEDQTSILWDLNGNIIQRFEGPDVSCDKTACFSPDGQKILTTSFMGFVTLWDLNGNEVQSFKGHNLSAKAMFLPDGKKIITASEDKTARIWNISEIESRILDGHSNRVIAVAVSPDGRKIFTGSNDRTVRMWDTVGKILKIFNCSQEKGIGDLAVSPDGQNFLTVTGDSAAILWDLQGNSLTVFKNPETRPLSVAISPDGKRIITGFSEGAVILWDLEGKQIQTFRGLSGYVYSVAFSPDGQKILAGANDKTARLWNLNGELLHVFEGHTDAVLSVAFSPDGKEILTGSRDKSARRWDLSGKLLRSFKGHTHYISSVKYSPDGRSVLTGSYDGTARIWSLNGELIQVFSGARGRVEAAFLKEGREIVTVSYDYYGRIYPVKLLYSEFIKSNSYEELGVQDKIGFGIIGISEIKNSEDDVLLANAVDYYTGLASQEEPDEKIKSLSIAYELNSKMVELAPEKPAYLLSLLRICTDSYKLDPSEKFINEIEKINQKILELKSPDDIYSAFNLYMSLASASDSTIYNLNINETSFLLFDKMIRLPGTDPLMKRAYLGTLSNTSWALLRNRQFSSGLKGLEICYSSDSTLLNCIAYTPMAFLLNDRFDDAARIMNKWKDMPLEIPAAKIKSYRDGFIYLITDLENRGITHSDFAKAKELLNQK